MVNSGTAKSVALLVLGVCLWGCGNPPSGGGDSGALDTGSNDAGSTDSGSMDTSTLTDAGSDASTPIDSDIDASTLTDAGSDASTPVDGSMPADAGMPVCSTLTLDGPRVAERMMTGSVPPFTGGTIVDGIYHLTDFEVYPPQTARPVWRQVTLMLSGGRLERIVNGPGLPAPQTIAGTYRTSGTSLTYETSCPRTGSFTWLYTATPTTLMMSAADDPNYRAVYTRTSP